MLCHLQGISAISGYVAGHLITLYIRCTYKVYHVYQGSHSCVKSFLPDSLASSNRSRSLDQWAVPTVEAAAIRAAVAAPLTTTRAANRFRATATTTATATATAEGAAGALSLKRLNRMNFCKHLSIYETDLWWCWVSLGAVPVIWSSKTRGERHTGIARGDKYKYKYKYRVVF